MRAYLTSRKVPQLFVLTGSNSLIDPKKYPWTMGLQSSYGLEGVAWAKYILAERPNAKIGIFYQDDDFGSDHMDPFLATLGDKAKTMVVGKESYAVTDPTVASQIISLKSAGADTFVIFGQSRAAAQAISAARDQAGADALIFVPYVSSAKSVLGAVGDEKLKGVISTDNQKDPSDPTWAGDPGGEAVSRMGEGLYAGAGPRIERVLARRLYRCAGHGRGAEAGRRHSHPRQHHEDRDQHEGLDLPDASARHHPQHVAR